MSAIATLRRTVFSKKFLIEHEMRSSRSSASAAVEDDPQLLVRALRYAVVVLEVIGILDKVFIRIGHVASRITRVPVTSFVASRYVGGAN